MIRYNKASINQLMSNQIENEDTIHLPKFLDPDGDGKVSAWEWAQSILIIVGVIFCFVFLTILGEI